MFTFVHDWFHHKKGEMVKSVPPEAVATGHAVPVGEPAKPDVTQAEPAKAQPAVEVILEKTPESPKSNS